MMSTESSSMQYSQKFDQIIVPSIHFVFFLCVHSFYSTSVFQISISSYHMIDVVYQIMILLAGKHGPVSRNYSRSYDYTWNKKISEISYRWVVIQAFCIG